jgi:hypothetical protein
MSAVWARQREWVKQRELVRALASTMVGEGPARDGVTSDMETRAGVNLRLSRWLRPGLSGGRAAGAGVDSAGADASDQRD